MAPQRVIGSHKKPKFKIIPLLLCFLSDPITNNYIKVRRSMINKILCIDSRICQKSPPVTPAKA